MRHGNQTGGTRQQTDDNLEWKSAFKAFPYLGPIRIKAGWQVRLSKLLSWCRNARSLYFLTHFHGEVIMALGTGAHAEILVPLLISRAIDVCIGGGRFINNKDMLLKSTNLQDWFRYKVLPPMQLQWNSPSMISRGFQQLWHCCPRVHPLLGANRNTKWKPCSIIIHPWFYTASSVAVSLFHQYKSSIRRYRLRKQ